MDETDPYGMSAAARAKRTGDVSYGGGDEKPWKRSDLRTYVRDRAWGLCEWPDCGNAGAEMAHIFGVGSGGRRSADYPDNVAWLCRRHHNTLDGRFRLSYDEAAPLIRSFPVRPDGTCGWYCDRPAETSVALVPLCPVHAEIASSDGPVSRRRSELAVALAAVVHRRNVELGLRP